MSSIDDPTILEIQLANDLKGRVRTRNEIRQLRGLEPLDGPDGEELASDQMVKENIDEPTAPGKGPGDAETTGAKNGFSGMPRAADIFKRNGHSVAKQLSEVSVKGAKRMSKSNDRREEFLRAIIRTLAPRDSFDDALADLREMLDGYEGVAPSGPYRQRDEPAASPTSAYVTGLTVNIASPGLWQNQSVRTEPPKRKRGAVWPLIQTTSPEYS